MVISKTSRRSFLQAAGPLILSPITVNGVALAAASERITVGVVGVGSRGFNLIDELLHRADAQIVAVCDVDSFHYRDRPWGKGPAFGRVAAKQKIEKAYNKSKKSGQGSQVDVYSDFRQVCRRDDIDAVVIATPDHWHAICALEAMRSGKDVYCEKPVTHGLREGQIVAREAASRAAVFQTGSQQRSMWNFRRAVELVRGGYLGKLQSIEVGLPPGYDKPQGDTSEKKPPESLDYDLWCGPAEVLPYMQARHHRWWRGHRAYGGGVLMDWIGHHNDIAHWAMAMDDSGPIQIEATGWEMPETDVYNTPWHYEIQCKYSNGVTTSIGDRHAIGCKFIGDEGTVTVSRAKLQASDERWTKEKFHPQVEGIYRSDNHMQNFIDCVRTRKQCAAPPDVASRSITPGHVGYVSHQLGRPLAWDPVKQQVPGDAQANELLYQIEYRSPWTLSR